MCNPVNKRLHWLFLRYKSNHVPTWVHRCKVSLFVLMFVFCEPKGGAICRHCASFVLFSVILFKEKVSSVPLNSWLIELTQPNVDDWWCGRLEGSTTPPLPPTLAASTQRVWQLVHLSGADVTIDWHPDYSGRLQVLSLLGSRDRPNVFEQTYRLFWSLGKNSSTRRTHAHSDRCTSTQLGEPGIKVPRK